MCPFALHGNLLHCSKYPTHLFVIHLLPTRTGHPPWWVNLNRNTSISSSQVVIYLHTCQISHLVSGWSRMLQNPSWQESCCQSWEMMWHLQPPPSQGRPWWWRVCPPCACVWGRSTCPPSVHEGPCGLCTVLPDHSWPLGMLLRARGTRAQN